MKPVNRRASRVGFALVAGIATTALGQGGDDPATAVPLSLNTLTGGTTIGYTNVSDEVCPYTGSTSPDVYYAYTPATSHNLTVELCESGYDTKTYVYDSSLNLIINVNGDASCNDDGCSSSGGGSFRSLLHCAPLEAGATYYVVVDGWGTEAGTYSITLHDSEVFTGDPAACQEFICIFDPCDPAHTPEGETCDDSGPDDCYNGGCNCQSGDPLAAFLPLACGESYCGEGWFNGEIRDTDFWRVDPETVTTFTFDGVAEFAAVLGRPETLGMHSCIGIPAGQFVVAEQGCEPLQIVTPALAPGTYWFFIGTSFSEVILCGDEMPGTDYVVSLSCVITPPPCPWDFDENGEVDFQDLLKLLANWGPCPGTRG